MVHSDIANDSFSYKFTTASVIVKLFSKKKTESKVFLPFMLEVSLLSTGLDISH